MRRRPPNTRKDPAPTTMAATTKTKTQDLIAGLTPAEVAQLRRDLAAEEARGGRDTIDRELTPRERVVGTFLRERDHMEGCPVHGATSAPYKTEAYDAEVTAPGAPLRAIGAQIGDTVTVARCHGCGGIRYLLGTTRHNIARALTDGAPPDPEIDPDDDTL